MKYLRQLHLRGRLDLLVRGCGICPRRRLRHLDFCNRRWHNRSGGTI